MAQNYPKRIEMKEGIDLLLSHAERMETEKVEINEAYGRILACRVRAKENIPPFDRSPYDGYAIRSADVAGAGHDSPVTLRIIEEVPAGHAPEKVIGPMEAVKILTGAPIPQGADAVEKYEDTSFTEKEVCFFSPIASGSNIVKAGEDVKKGEIVMEEGEYLSPASVGLLAGLGYGEVEVFKKPRVRIISTGNELLQVSEELKPGKIRNSSAYMLQGFLRQWGVDADIYGIVKDDEESIKEALKDCLAEDDCVITTGGASVGDYDLALSSMEGIGAEVLFWQVKDEAGNGNSGSGKGRQAFIRTFRQSQRGGSGFVFAWASCIPQDVRQKGIQSALHTRVSAGWVSKEKPGRKDRSRNSGIRPGQSLLKYQEESGERHGQPMGRL